MRVRLACQISTLHDLSQRHIHAKSWLVSGNLTRTEAWRVKRLRNTLAGMPGADQGVTQPGAMMPAVAKLVSSATALRRSKTVTSWPSVASS